MDIDKLAITRRSKRTYLNKPVEFEKIAELLDIARNAPSPGNLQHWKFVVVTDKSKQEQIAEACLDQTWMNSAPVFIVISADIAHAERLYHSKAEEYSNQP
jgi:FMN reductase (NADPH)